MNVAAFMDMNNIRVPAIEFRNVSLSFDGAVVLSDINFKVRQGEMVFLTGASASGKSVLLRVAMGLLRPDAGQVFIEGREIENLDESELLAIRGGSMGMVFQEDSLFTGLTVYENAAYRLQEHDWSEDDIRQAVSEVLRFVGLDGEEEKFPEELSGGMKRRLEIARALIGWPRIMLFDEPTMSLDPLAALKVLDLVIRARDVKRISSLYVTKKMNELSYLTSNRPESRVLVLDRGKMIFSGSVQEFFVSDLPAVRELLTLDPNDHTKDPYFANPWDKQRQPKESIL
jgi:phospholipid/cholesterol/gamma-HCH transport system ATP-binding protein